MASKYKHNLSAHIYEPGVWPKYFIEVIVIALKKKPKHTEFSDHRTILEKISFDLEKKKIGMQLGC
jgi:hypothetical protein